MAHHATGIDEFLQPRARCPGEGVGLAVQIGVERRGRHQGPLIGADRLRNILCGHGIPVISECCLEQGRIARNAAEPILYRLQVGLTGSDRRGKCLYHLVLDALAIASPVNNVQRRVEVRRGIARRASVPYKAG